MTWRDFLFFYFCWNVGILYLPKPGSTSAVKNNLNSSYARVALLALLDKCSEEWQESGGRERGRIQTWAGRSQQHSVWSPIPKKRKTSVNVKNKYFVSSLFHIFMSHLIMLCRPSVRVHASSQLSSTDINAADWGVMNGS